MNDRRDTYLCNGKVYEIKNNHPPRFSLQLKVEAFLSMLLRNKEVVEAIARDEELSSFYTENQELSMFARKV